MGADAVLAGGAVAGASVVGDGSGVIGAEVDGTAEVAAAGATSPGLKYATTAKLAVWSSPLSQSPPPAPADAFSWRSLRLKPTSVTPVIPCRRSMKVGTRPSRTAQPASSSAGAVSERRRLSVPPLAPPAIEVAGNRYVRFHYSVTENGIRRDLKDSLFVKPFEKNVFVLNY